MDDVWFTVVGNIGAIKGLAGSPCVWFDMPAQPPNGSRLKHLDV